MKYKSEPQIFHNKEDKPKQYIIYPTDLFIAINNLCTGNEAKILLTLLACKGDGSFSPNIQYMQNMTGISKPNNFYAIRKTLTDKKYIEEQDGDIYINTEYILKKYEQSRKSK